LLKVASGEGVLDSIWHTHWMIELFVPTALPAMRAARQQKGELDFTLINKVHVPVAIASMVLLALIIGHGLLRQCRDHGASTSLGDLTNRNLLAFAITIGLTILGNAVVCGVFANPHDRYGARIVWLATLVVAIAPWLPRGADSIAVSKAQSAGVRLHK